MKPLMLATFEIRGAMWTAILETEAAEGDAVAHARAPSLVFVRDWIVGGTRRVTVPISGPTAQALGKADGPNLDQCLVTHLERALGSQSGSGSSLRPCAPASPTDSEQ